MPWYSDDDVLNSARDLSMTVQQTPLAANMIIARTTHEGINRDNRRTLQNISVAVAVVDEAGIACTATF